MGRPLSYIGIIIVAVYTQGVSQNPGSSLPSLLPPSATTAGWCTVDTARLYRGEDLFHLIDGGADLFFEYGFRQALAVEYQMAGGVSINLELYEMSDPGASYGIYSIRVADGSAPIDIGEDGSVHPYYIMFWKGRYYVSVAGSDSTSECRRRVEIIARAVDQNITERAQKPRIVESLPKENLHKQRYFRGYLGLSTTRLLDEKDLFHSIEGVVGIYNDHSMLLVAYGSPAKAKQCLQEVNAYLKSSTRFRNYRLRGGVSTATDSKDGALCVGQFGLHILVSFAADEAVAQALWKSAAVGAQ